MIALALYRFATLDLPSHTPCPVFPHFLAISTDSVRTLWTIGRDIVAEVHILEEIRIIFLNGFSTDDRT